MFLAGLAPFVDSLTLIGRMPATGGPFPHLLPPEVRVVGLPYYEDASRAGGLAGSLPLSIARYWRALGDADAVLLFGPHPLALVFALLALVRRRKLVLGVRQHYPEYIRHRHPGRRLLQLVAWGLEAAWHGLSVRAPTIVVGPDLARSFKRARRLLPITVALMRDADVVTDAEALAKSYEGDLRVLSVGRIDAEKNPLLLAEVLEDLRATDDRWLLTVCGDGPLRASLERRLTELGVAAAADLRGYVPVDDGLAALYRDSHMLIQVSFTEGFPQVLVEAFGSGLPAVATEVGGVGRGEERDALKLVPPADARACADALRAVAADEGLRAHMVETGLKIAREHTLERECSRVAAFIEEDRP